MKIYTWAGMPEGENGAVISNSAVTTSGFYVFGGSYSVSLDSQTVAPALDTFYARPFSLSQMGQTATSTRSANESVGPYLNAIATNITVAAGAGGVVRYGIYTNTSNTNLYPDTRIFDSGDLATTSITFLNASVFLTLNPARMYWYTLLFGVAAPTIRANGKEWMLSGGADTTFTPVSNSLTVAQAYGALPSTFPSGAVPEATTNYGRVYIRVNV